MTTQPDNAWALARRLLALAAPFRGAMALSVLLATAMVATGIGLMATSAYLIATAALHPSIAALSVPIVGVRFFGLSRGAFRYLERLVSHDVTFRLLARLRVRTYRAIEPLAPAGLARHHSGDLLGRIVGDVETLQHFFLRVISPPLVAVAVALLTGLFLWFFSPALAALVWALMLVAGIVLPLAARHAGRRSAKRTVALRAALHTELVDGIQGAADLLALGGDARQQERVRHLSRTLVSAQAHIASLTGAHTALGGMLAHLALWGTLLVAIPLVSAGRLEGVYLPVVTLAALASFEALQALPATFQHLDSSLEAARRLFELETVPPPVVPPAHPAPAPQQYAVALEELSFRHVPQAAPALERVSFQLPPGRRVAVVGPSGAGKSTLAALLLRFQEPSSGRIVLGGRDLRDYDPETVRRLIAVVPQHTHLFNASVRENLLLARPEASEAELIEAALRAQIHDVIAALPQGYDTLIGEQGLHLSGGERQRLAIARALLKDAPILILDEATSHLDALTERRVLDALFAATADRALLLITHRLAGIEAMEEILVLEQGRIVERGRHDELLQWSGRYRRLWEAAAFPERAGA